MRDTRSGARLPAVTRGRPVRPARPVRPIAAEPTAERPAAGALAAIGTGSSGRVSPPMRAAGPLATSRTGTPEPAAGAPAAIATGSAAVVSPPRRGPGPLATAGRPASRRVPWHRHGSPHDACRPPEPIARDDPRFRGLPFDDERVVRFTVPVTSREAMVRSIGFLITKGWCVHRAGLAMCAHHPSGRRWIVGFDVGAERPAWLNRLPTLTQDPTP